MDSLKIIEIASHIAAFFLIAAMLLAFWRLAKGPDIPDKIVALDMIGVIMIGIVAGYSIYVNQPLYLIIGVILALIIFLGTVAVAKYLERRFL